MTDTSSTNTENVQNQITDINENNTNIEYSKTTNFLLKNQFCQIHHSNNFNLLGYSNYLKNKNEGRWLVYSWTAFFSQPFFFIFNRMYLFAFIYSTLFGLFFGYNIFYGISFMLIFPFFAFKLYEIHADHLYIRSVNKYNKFYKKYLSSITESSSYINKLKKIQNNSKLSEKQKNKKLEKLKQSQSNSSKTTWNYSHISEYTYFYDKIKPLSTLGFIPTSFFMITFCSFVSLYSFASVSTYGSYVKNFVSHNIDMDIIKHVPNQAEKEQLSELLLLNDFNNQIYGMVDEYFIQSVLLNKGELSDSKQVDYINKLLNKPKN